MTSRLEAILTDISEKFIAATTGKVWVARSQSGKLCTTITATGFDGKLAADIAEQAERIRECGNVAAAQRIAEYLPGDGVFVNARVNVSGSPANRTIQIIAGGGEVVRLVRAQGDFMGGEGVREVARITAGFNGNDSVIVVQGKPGASFKVGGYKNRTSQMEVL